ncbi:hypothetical protein BBSC_2324 [Bifidobacterium scardovii JCM 12489 = DSM 13734]|nr:hypothetical protein BBSC_2324 [Bifidobacterium scardovii JCM 12489 = DSM 13734]
MTAPSTIARFAKPMRPDITNHVHRKTGDFGESIIDALPAPTRQNVGGGYNHAGHTVRHTGRRDAYATDMHAFVMGTYDLA